jgi:hypothetical protein
MRHKLNITNIEISKNDSDLVKLNNPHTKKVLDNNLLMVQALSSSLPSPR